MSIPLIDRGNYYRGLLVLIRRDRVIDESEREMMIQLGQKLDFDRRFCENAIDDILRNPNIKDRPMPFSDKATAESFLNDAISLSLADGDIHPKELSWLESVSHANGFDGQWLSARIKELRAIAAQNAQQKTT